MNRKGLSMPDTSSPIVKQFLELTAIPGISMNERQIIDYLKEFLIKTGIEYYEDNAGEKIGGNAGNLICKIKSSSPDKRTYLFAAHVDTVSPSCKNPVVKNGRIVSSDENILGADDRVGVTVLLEILKLIGQNKIEYPNLDIVFLVAEEVGLLGSKFLDYSKIAATGGFNFDCSAPVGHVVVRAPTALDFEIKFIGKEAHSAVAPEKGINAIRMASSAIAKMNIPQKNGDTVFNIGEISGGIKNNIIPGKVIVNGEIRSFNQQEINQYLNRICVVTENEVKNFGGEFEFLQTPRYDTFTLNENCIPYQITKKAVQDSNVEYLPISYLAGSDANILNKKNISTVNLGLGYVNNHSSDEFILISDLVKDVEIGSRIVRLASEL